MIVAIDGEPVATEPAVGAIAEDLQVTLWIVAQRGVAGSWAAGEMLKTPAGRGTWESGTQRIDPDARWPWQGHQAEDGRWWIHQGSYLRMCGAANVPMPVEPEAPPAQAERASCIPRRSSHPYSQNMPSHTSYSL